MRTIFGGTKMNIHGARLCPSCTRASLLRVFSASKTTPSSSSSSSSSSFSSSSFRRKVAFLGLGNMGFPMAVNMTQKLGPDVVIAFDLNDQTMDEARKAGMTVATSIESIITNKEMSPSTIITMLPGDAAVNKVMQVISENYDPDKAHNRISTIIDCSTVSPTTSRYWYNTFHNHSNTKDPILFVDAPVSGGVKGAQNASLTFMVGTTQHVMNQHEDNVINTVLSTMASRVIACGGPGSGSVVKLCNNLALAAQMVGICEAMNLGEALDVDPQVVADVMNTSTAKSWSCSINNPHPQVAELLGGSPASNGYKGGFGTRLMLKDLGLAVSAGKDAGVALPLGNLTKELYQLADLRGLGDKDFSVMLQFLRGK